MRVAEWIQGGFAVLLAVAAWLSPLPAQRRRRITILAGIVVAVIALAWSTAYWLPAAWSVAIRDWLPVALMLVPYWQTGQFFLGPNLKIQNWLMDMDLRWLERTSARSGTARTRLGLTFEIAYVFCYPFVPLGLGALYIAGLRARVDEYWFVVLTATYICYAITPFFPAMPPRVVARAGTPDRWAPVPAREQANKGQRFNRWIQEWGSIHAISFPSAHVASTLAVSLVLTRHMHITGIFFLFVAGCIAVAAVAGRYHYTLDVLLGLAVALAVFGATYSWF
jgi:membrane-associated phospholipid phosphatase